MVKVQTSLAAAVILLAGLHGLAARDALGADDLILHAPDEYCALDRDHPADRAARSEFRDAVMDDRATLLALYADCREVEALRSNGGGFSELRHYAAYLEYTDIGDTFRGLSRRETLARLYEASRSAALNDPAFNPALHRDDFALYSGGVFKENQWVATVGALTVISGRHISLIAVDIEQIQPELDGLLARQRGNMERLIAANE